MDFRHPGMPSNHVNHIGRKLWKPCEYSAKNLHDSSVNDDDKLLPAICRLRFFDQDICILDVLICIMYFLPGSGGMSLWNRILSE